MENRRLLLAALLSLVVLIGWSYLFPARPVQVVEPARQEAMEPKGEQEPLGLTLSGSQRPTLDDSPDAAQQLVENEPVIDLPVIKADLETSVVVETDAFRADLTNRGAQLRSFLLKEHLTPEGEPLDLVRTRGEDPYPFGLISADGRPSGLNEALFVVEREKAGAKEGETIRFRHHSDVGTAEKNIRISPDGLLEVEITVSGERGWSFVLGPGIRNLTPEEMDARFLERKVAFRRGGEEEEINAREADEDEIVPTTGLRWVTLEDNFFLVAAVHESDLSRAGVSEVVVRPVLQRSRFDVGEARFLPVAEEGDGGEYQHDLLVLLRASAPTVRVVTYFGAKTFSTLAALPYGLEETVRWGFFGFLSRPLYLGLEWIHKNIVANYGWAIILMTFLIKLAFAPLTHKSQKSMGKMQEINPKIKALQARYRHKLKDKQGRPNMEARRQMNEETMALYRDAGVNPAGGCLPILLQIPVFFAFFRLLSTAVELRNASWLLWVKDLSAPDPYYLLPIAMGVSGIVLQQMTPSAPDPMQRRMMQIMPIMFAFFAITFPSGLVLYWLTNNLLTMAQQSWYMKRKTKQEAAAKGAAKKARDE